MSRPIGSAKVTMNPVRSTPLAGLTLLASLLLAACSTLPPDNAVLASARASFVEAQNNPQTRELAAAELATAGTALSRADEALKRGDSVAEVNNLAYLARPRVALAQQTGRQKAADAQLVSAEAERDRTRLAARTNEADAASRQAEAAQRQAQMSQQDAQAAERAAASARMQTQSAQAQTLDAQARARQLEEQMLALNAKKTERGMVVTISDVLFDTGRAELKSGSARDMGKLAEFFKAYPERTALIEGFTDSVGGEAANQDLSNRRADAVRSALVGMGVARERINVRGYGEAFPVAGNDNASGRQMNRRVEVVLSDDSGQVRPR